jgi:peroxiredoxin
MLADGNGAFAKALGLDVDLNQAGMGARSRRYSMVVENGVVKTLNVEDRPGVNVSGADTILQQL